jgi:site-specific DNA-methyltransferase (adenine-specific)
MDKMKIEYLPVESLTPYEKNARKHGDFDVGIIKKSIEEFGFNDPIGIWGTKNIIVEGHGRLQAAKELGMKEVPVIRLDHLTDQQRKMYALEHNRSAEMSSWDIETMMDELKSLEGFDFDALGFGEFFLADEAEEVVEDDYDPILPAEPVSKMGDIYLLGNHRVMCGDSTLIDSVNLLVNNEQVDLFYTDPPYNVNVENSEGMTIENDDLSDDSFRALLDGAFENAAEVMKDGAVFYV